MTFTVTWRGRDGGLREEAVEAASRAECFAQCKARGVVPVSVKDGARKGGRQDVGSPSGRNESQPFPKRKLFTLRFCLLVAIAALAAIAWWRLAAREDVRPSDPAPMKTKPTEKPKAKPATVPATNSAPRLVRHRRPKTVPVATADVAPPDLPMFAEAPRRRERNRLARRDDDRRVVRLVAGRQAEQLPVGHVVEGNARVVEPTRGLAEFGLHEPAARLEQNELFREPFRLAPRVVYRPVEKHVLVGRGRLGD